MNRFRWFLPMMAMLLTIGCHGITTPAPEKTALHILVASKGTVEVIKRDWTNFSPVSFGELISPGDILLVAEGGTANIVCSDLSKRSLQVGPPGPVPCPAAGELTAIDSHLLMRSVSKEDCPALISPRAGRLINPRPEVRWKAISKTRDYSIALQAGVVGWRRDVHLAVDALEGQMPYPQDALPIAPGSPVAVKISGGSETSDECSPRQSELLMLTETEQTAIHQAEQRIDGLGLSALETSYLRANLLLSHELYTDAIRMLNSMSPTPNAAVAVDRLLGDAYNSIDLDNQARNSYQNALGRIADFPDMEAEATLNDALARLTQDESVRLTYLNRAVELYKKLGNTKRVSELTRR